MPAKRTNTPAAEAALKEIRRLKESLLDAGVKLRDFRDKRAASLSLRRIARETLTLADELSPRTPPLPLEAWSAEALLGLVRDVQDDVRAGVTQESSEDGFGMVLSTLRKAGLDTSALPEDEDEDEEE